MVLPILHWANLRFYKKKKQYLTNWAICIFAEIKFAFEVYDFKGEGKVDAFYIGDLIRACNLNPTMNTIENMCGGLKEKGKRMIVLDEMYPIFKKAKDSKDTGGIHDFVEILKLYDKNEDKTILSKDLFRLLTNLGKFSGSTRVWKSKGKFFFEIKIVSVVISHIWISHQS